MHMNLQIHTETKRIHIDQKPYESPNPTTGEALYILGRVQPGLELYREVSGDKEDAPVPNGPEAIHLKEDEHFHSGTPKEYTIIVNGRKKVVMANKVTFEQIVRPAFDPVPTGPNILFTVTYGHGPKANPEGALLEDQTVKIKDGMVFSVTPTDKS
jgi:Multiubiquitin